MNQDCTTSSASHDVDIEAQTKSSKNTNDSRPSSLGTAARHTPSLHRTSSNHMEEPLSRVSCVVQGVGDQDVIEPLGNTHETDASSPCHEALPSTNIPAGPRWKPWRADEPLRTWVKEDPQITAQDWVKEMDASDNGMCRGWRDQIDTLIIFSGLFSATVTAFTVESYQWLNETPTDTLARLQLRDRFDAAQNPDIDRLAPATFSVSSTSVAINTLWFASLTLSLAAVVISILCKQWLHEYQRYDNFTTDEAFLIRGLRYRGLMAWRVPEIIASLPPLLQTALILFLVGVLILLWLLQTIVASIVTIIVGMTFLFLVVTTALPSIQYIFPRFDTQCAYKSSQSWSFFLLSAFWLFDFFELPSWGSFDRWEVTCVYSGLGHTLSRVYKLVGNSTSTAIKLNWIITNRSLKPTINEHLTVLSDFVSGLGTPQMEFMGVHCPAEPEFEGSKTLQRVEQLKVCHMPSRCRRGQRLGFNTKDYHPLKSYSSYLINYVVGYSYYLATQRALSKLLERKDQLSQQQLFNRYIDHWVRGFDIEHHITEGGKVSLPETIYSADIPYDPEVAIYLVDFHAHLLKTDLLEDQGILLLLNIAYPNLMKFYPRYKTWPRYKDMMPAVTLLQDVQEWVDRVPDSDLYKKALYAGDLLLGLKLNTIFFRNCAESPTTEFEKKYLISFARFFVALYEPEEFLEIARKVHGGGLLDVERALAFLREYLNQNESISL